MIWSLRGGNLSLDFRSRVRIMGILNVTPDSFYDGGRYDEVERAVDRALLLEAEGADIVDIGGESSRPPMYGVAAALSAHAECRRVIPVVEAIRARSRVPISIDTTKAEVAREALAAGADIVNDISALGDPEMAPAAAEAGAAVILMHRRGTPETMQLDTRYEDLLGEVACYLRSRIDAAAAAGVSRRNLGIDPGLGFGKSTGGNFTLIAELSRFRSLGCPVIVGASRKSFLWKPLGLSAGDCLEPSLAAAALAVARGANAVRVHDVAASFRAVRTAEAVARSSQPGALSPESGAQL